MTREKKSESDEEGRTLAGKTGEERMRGEVGDLTQGEAFIVMPRQFSLSVITRLDRVIQVRQ